MKQLATNLRSLLLCLLALQACQTKEDTLQMKEDEGFQQFLQRVWKTACPSIGQAEDNSNLIQTIDNQTYMFAYCGSEGNYTYLLLKQFGAFPASHSRLKPSTRKDNPTEKYYGFPNFGEPMPQVVDVNGDGRQELVIGVPVSGKASGAGAEAEEMWDETFYEVYQVKDSSVVKSPELTKQYVDALPKEKPSQPYELIEDAHIQLKFEDLKGNYIEASMIDEQLHWGKCGGHSILIDKKENSDTYAVWYNQILDGYYFRVNTITGDASTNTCELYCHAPAPEEDGFIPVEIKYAVINDVHCLQIKDRYFMLDEDKHKVPEDTEECEEEEH